MKLLMCHPDFYGIEYEINPWMDKNIDANSATASKQWRGLYETLLGCDAQIELVSPAQGWPDMVFTANAGLFYKNKIILAHFKHKERQGETPYFKAWFAQAGYEVIAGSETLPFEGAGDALQAGDTLFAGYGFRTDRRFYEQISYFDQSKIVFCELVDPHFYHLDTCFCPLNDSQAIWYPQAFTPETQKRMANAIELFAVTAEEASCFACNAVVLNKNIVLPTGCPQITATLNRLGFTVHACEMGEYLKAGGACKCLTLRID